MLSEVGVMNDANSLNNSCSTATSDNDSGIGSNKQVQESSSSIPFQTELQTSGTTDTSPIGKYLLLEAY